MTCVHQFHYIEIESMYGIWANLLHQAVVIVQFAL